MTIMTTSSTINSNILTRFPIVVETSSQKKFNLLLQTASMEMDVVTVATKTSQLPNTPASRGMPSAPINIV